MLARNSCPICKGNKGDFAYAVVAPWIRELSELTQSHTKLVKCENCSFTYFTNIYDDSEMTKLYSNYRSNKYFQYRRRWEPWFGKKELHAYSTSNSEAVKNRNSKMQDLFRKSGLDLANFSNCVDFGGDLGQFIPSEIQGSKYIIDPSNSTLSQEGITRISSIEFLPFKAELFLNLFVLEHISDVNDALVKINRAQNIGSYGLIQVPTDKFNFSRLHAKNGYNSYLFFLTKHHYLFVLVDFLSGISRMLFGRIPVWGVIKMSEHINYFTETSLEELIKRNGYAVVNKEIDPGQRQGKIKLGSMSFVVKKIRELS